MEDSSRKCFTAKNAKGAKNYAGENQSLILRFFGSAQDKPNSA
jgi:hypothetical protein